MTPDPTAEALALCDFIDADASVPKRPDDGHYEAESLMPLVASYRRLAADNATLRAERDELKYAKDQLAKTGLLLDAASKDANGWAIACKRIAAERDQLRAELAACRRLIHASGLWKTAPCRICGYNGPDYYKPEVHKCAGPDPDAAKCPHCGLTSCYHCWECGNTIEEHKPGCKSDPSPDAAKEV